MEDALAHELFEGVEEKQKKCLNPCCNGRCTRTKLGNQRRRMWFKCLNPCCNGRCTRTYFQLQKQL